MKNNKLTNVGIVFNFHHWRGSLEEFPELFKRIQPYLIALNLNGMSSQHHAVSQRALHRFRCVRTVNDPCRRSKPLARSSWHHP